MYKKREHKRMKLHKTLTFDSIFSHFIFFVSFVLNEWENYLFLFLIFNATPYY